MHSRNLKIAVTARGHVRSPAAGLFLKIWKMSLRGGRANILIKIPTKVLISIGRVFVYCKLPFTKSLEFFFSRLHESLRIEPLIDLLNGGSTRRSAGSITSGHSAAGHTTWHTVGHSTASTLVHLGDDRSADLLELLLLVFELVLFSSLVGVEPLDGVVALVSDGLDLIS